MPIRRGRYRSIFVKYIAGIDRRIPFDIHVYEVQGPRHVPIGDAVVHLEGQSFSRLARTNAEGAARFDLSLAPIGDLVLTVTGDDVIPEIATVTIAGPEWVTGRVVEISHQEGSPDCTLIRLEQYGPNGAAGTWFARREVADYGLIVDAVTDAYVSKQAISLFVTDTRGAGTIERFRFTG
jgi:hypothetical protein